MVAGETPDGVIGCGINKLSLRHASDFAVCDDDESFHGLQIPRAHWIIDPWPRPAKKNKRIDEDAFLAGRMLIAMPGIGDPRFERAVILDVRPFGGAGDGYHRQPADGGIGSARLVRPAGGPVLYPRTRSARAFWRPGGGASEGSCCIPTTTPIRKRPLSVTDGVSLTATREILDAIGDPVRKPRCAALALGCANWEAGQLEDELKENVWLACDADEALIFDDDHDTKWSRALAKLGVAPERLSMQTGRA